MRKQYSLLSLKRPAFLLVVFSLVTFLSPLLSIAQNDSEKGLPFITNYSAKTYKALPQTWCVQEDDRGMMYFGIQNFILEYDGVKWRKIVPPSTIANTVVRSFAKNKDGRIYFGALGDLGYLESDSLGQTRARSLIELIPNENRNFNDIWSAYAAGNSIYFQSREYIFRLSEPQPGSGKREVKVWKPQTRFMYSFYLDDSYYVHQQGLGLFKMAGDSLVLIPGSEFLGKERMQVMLPYNQEGAGKQYLVGMFYGGLYLYDGKTFRRFVTEADPYFQTGAILYKAILLKNGNYALGSTGLGVMIIDARGKLLQRINRDVGLQDESVYGTYQDKKGTLWLAMDNGISRVETASPLSQFTLQSGINTGVLSVKRFDGDLYVGTTNGLLHFDKNKSFFNAVPGIPQNQIFNIVPDGDKLLVPGDGLFAVRGGKASTIRQSVSADLTISGIHVLESDTNVLLTGGQFGLSVFTKKKISSGATGSSTWNFLGRIDSVTDQVWAIVENKEGEIWGGTQSGVAYRITLTYDAKGIPDLPKTKIEKFGAEAGLKNGLGLLYVIKGTNYFVADSGLFRFDNTVKRYIPDTTFGTFPNGGLVNEFDMAEDYQGRVWIRAGKMMRLAIPRTEGGYRLDDTQLGSLSDFTIQKLYPEKDGVIWFGTTDGLIRYDENIEKKADQSFKALLRHVSAEKIPLAIDEARNKNYSSISYNNNTLRFEYAAPFFEQESKTQYQTWLEGFEPSWSDLDNNYYKEYTNLSPGKYTFHVRAENIFHKLSEEAVYSFEILPPWYRTWWAYTLYVLAAIGILGFIVRYRTRQLKAKHKELENLVAHRTAELSHRVEELAVINSVQEGLVKEVGMQDIYDMVGEKIRTIFNAQIIDIATYDKKTNLLEDRYAYEKGDRTLVGAWEPKGFRKHVIDSGQLLLVDEKLEQKSLEFNSPVIHGEQPKSAVFVPLITNNEVKGMISLQNLDKEHAFPDSSIRLLTTLANSMSVALESARRFDETNRLLKETEQRTAELAVINSAQEGLAKELDMQAIYDLVGNKIADVFKENAQAVLIATLDQDSRSEHFNYVMEKGERFYLKPRQYDKLREHLVDTKQKILINENYQDAAARFGLKVLPGTELPKSLLFVPLISGDKVKSYVSLQNVDKEKAFSESDVRLLETLANSMSVALANARLFDETNRLLKETEQRNAELAVINSVQESLVARIDIQGIYELVGEKIREIFDAQVIDIVTYDKTGNLIEDRYAYEKGDRTILGPREPKGFRKHVIQTRQVLMHNENVEQKMKEFGNPILIGDIPKSQMYVPMIAGNEVKGIISLQNLDHENAFTNSDVNLLTTLANSMSVALESARLFDETNRLLKETEQRNAELGVINSVQEGLVAQLSIQGIYDLVGEKIREILNAEVIDIVTYDKKVNRIEDRYSFEKGDRTLIGPREPKGFRKHVIETRQGLVINKDVDKHMEEYGNEVLIGATSKSNVFVPLLSDGDVTGIISIQNIEHENAFSDSDVSLITTLANSMSIALKSARLFDETNRLLKETEQRNAELGVINSVQDGLVRKMDMEGIYEMIGEKIREIFDAQVIDIVTYDHKSNMIADMYSYEKGDRTLVGPRPASGFRRHIIETGQELILNNDIAEKSKLYDNPVILGEIAKSAVFVPMKTGDKVSGIISLQNLDHEYAFSDSDLRLLTTLSNSMSIALESARLFDETKHLLKETEQRNAELAVINSVQDGLVREMDIQGIYDLVGEKMREIFDAQVIDIVTYDRKGNTIEDRYSYEKGDRTIMGKREPFGFRKHVIETMETLFFNDNVDQHSKTYNNPVLTGESPKSLVFVPMIAGNEVTGVISLQNVDHEHAFSDSDVRLLSTLSNSMSVALESARLFDETARLLKETEQRNAELAVINSVQESLVAQMDMQGIYELVGEKMREIFNAQVIDIVTYDKKTNHIEDRYAFEKGDRTLLGSREPKGFRRYVVQTGQMLAINKDVEKLRPIYDNTVIVGQAAKSLVLVPMIAGGEVNGVISLQNLDQEDAFSESDISLLSTLVNSMSVALKSARLFDETNRLLKETEQRNAELAVINSVQESLVAQIDIQSIYDLVGEKMRTIFNAQVIDIVTYDKETNVIEDRYSFEKGDRTLVKARAPKGFRKHVIQSGQILVINKDIEKLRPLYDNTVVTGQAAKSVVLVPMIAGGEVTGVISLQNLDQEDAFSESDVSLLSTLVNSMSVALKSARLFDETNRLLKETEQRTAELAVINSVQEGLAKELDIQGIYNLVGDRLCDLFPDSHALVIRTFDHETKLETWQFAQEKGSRQFIDPRPFNWNSKLLIETRKPLDIRENYVQIAKVHGSTGVTAGQPPKSAVFVPMVSGDVVKGSVSLQNVDKENAFSDADIRLLTTITNSMSVALENARLFEETNRLLNETEQKTAELAVINSVQEGLVREMHIQAIYDLVGTRICELFDTQTVIIRTFEHRAQIEHWQYAIEKGQRLYSNPRQIIWANKLLIESKQALLINQNYLETAQKYGGAGVSKGLPPKSALFVPMIVGDVVRGSVSLQNVEKENAFTDSDLRLLTTLTNSMSVAIENARLFDETNRLLGEAKQRATELSTVNSISQALTSQLNTEELIKLVGDQMKNLFNANIVYLALLDEKTKIIHFPYMEGDTLTPMKLGKGLTSKIILTGKPLLINKEVTAKAEELGITSVGVPAASYLGVPIPVGDEIIGVLSVQSTESENRFNENDERLLSTIAASVGVALRKAQLFEEVSSARKQAEEATKVAEKANQAKSAFLSTVSHELRTPLTSVLGFAKIIKKRLDEKIFPATSRADTKIEKTIQQVSDNLNVVVSEGERLTNLINEVLDLAKIEAGKMEWNMESVSMQEIMERATAATTSLFEQKNLVLEKYIDPNLPLISGDRDKLIQVVVNLISNAVKFTPAGKVVCRAEQKKHEIVVGIQDTGIGIAPQDHAAVFEQFKQVVGDTLTDKPKGTGLGLPICKEIVEHHEGRIWLESELGKGSTFYFALPIPKADGSKPVQFNDLVRQLKEQMAHSQLKMNGKHATILVVDDDDSIRSLLQQELGDAGYLIEEAKNGKEALASIRNHRPDLVILDVMMPEMNGFDVAAVLKNDPETMDIPIIVLSIVQDKARGFKIGVDRYLTKPIDTNQLFSEVGSLLEQGKSKKKVMVVDEDTTAVRSLTDVLQAKGYVVVESDGKELVEKAISTQPDIIILNSVISDKHEIVQSLRFEKGLENVLFLVYQ